MNRSLSPYRCRALRLSAALLMGTAFTGLCAMPSLAQPANGATAARDFAIRSQPLVDAMRELSRVTGIQVAYTASIGSGVVSPGVTGSFAPAEALSRLLVGTGLTFHFTGPNAVTLEPAPQAADGAIALGPVRVEGAGRNAPPTSVLGTLPEAYAGGQIARGGQVGMLGNKDVMDTPFSQTNYTNKTIQDQQARTVQEILSNDPSIVSNTRSSGNERGSNIIRGFFDSAEGGAGTLNGLVGVAPLRAPDMDYIERVEVLRGPSALLNGMAASGAGSLGGTYNLVTKQAGDEPLTQITLRYGGRSQLGAHLDVGRRFGSQDQFGIRVNGAFRDGGTPVKSTSAKIGSAALNLDYRGERVRISADLAHQTDNTNPRNAQIGTTFSVDSVGFVPKAPDVGKSLSPSWSYNKEKSTVVMLRGEVDISDDVTAYGAIGKLRWDFSFMGPGWSSVLDASGTMRASGDLAYRNHSAYDSLSMQGGLRARVTTGPVGHALSLNLSRSERETRENDYVSAAYINVTNLYNPTFGPAPILPDPGPLGKANETRVSSIGVSDTLSILDEQVQFTAGIRYQKVKSGNFDRSSGAKTSSYDSKAWSPAFGLVVKPQRNISLYANYIENLQSGTIVGTTFANAGEVFPPYVSKQYEAGAKVDWGAVTTTLAAFQIAQPSTIRIEDPLGGLPTLALNGEQRNRGIELNAYGEPVHGFRLMGGLTLLDAKLTKTQGSLYDGNRAYAAPKFRTVVSGEWDTPFLQGLTLTGRIAYTGRQVVSNTSENPKTPSYSIADLGVRYALGSPWNNKPITIRFNVDNVLGKNYWATPYFGLLFLGEPRTYRLSATFDF